MKKSFARLLTLAVGLGALAAGSSAKAVATLTVFDGTTLITVTDGGAGDFNPAPGAVGILYAPVGSAWAGNIQAGLSKGSLGSASNPQLDLLFSGNSTSAGTLTITWGDDNFIAPAPSGNFIANVGGTLAAGIGSSISYSTFYSAANGLPAASPLTGPITATNTLGPVVPFGGSAGGSTAGISNPPGFSLMQQIVITNVGAGVTTGNAHLAVPEGGFTLSLLGGAMIGMGLIRRKMTRQG